MEIKYDLDFRRPPKITDIPLGINKDKYCEFHEGVNHNNEGCIALRMLIKKFIKNEKLVRFLWEQRS